MRIEVIATGDELCLGEIVDTNSAFLAQSLGARGLGIARITVVGDGRDEIAAAIRAALERSQVVLVTGGLGPTEDDLTREALADVLGVALQHRPEAEAAIVERLRRPLSEQNRRQTRAPAGATLLANAVGTAPGIRAVRNGASVYVMPGVPHEMRAMFTHHVLPRIIAGRPDGDAFSAVRYLVVHGVPESQLAAKLSGIASAAPEASQSVTVGTRVRSGTIVVRVRTGAPETQTAERLAAAAADEIRSRLGESIAGEGDHGIAYFAARAALDRGLTMAVAESCTGGLVAAGLVRVPGVSASLLESVVAYSNDSKVRRLGVDPGLIERHGAVSAEVARAMAEGVRKASGADIAASVTGIAGPGGGSDQKPVGLAYVASSSRLGTDVVERRFSGERPTVMERAAEATLWMLLREARRKEVRATDTVF
jgi:nicotinamide-nucleotide amidase